MEKEINKKVIEIRWRGQLFDDPTLIICSKEDLKEALNSVTSCSYDNIKSIIIKDSNDDKNKTFDEMYEESVGAVQLGHKCEGENKNVSK